MQDKFKLDSHKLLWHYDRVKDLLDGKRIAPITIDWALTQECPYKCIYCYSQCQKNPRRGITRKVAFDFINDAAEIGVKAVSLVSDGESTIVPFYYDLIAHGKSIGLDMAGGTCGYYLKENKLLELLKNVTYYRFNVSAGTPKRYAEIHGVTEQHFHRVYDIIKKCVEIKRNHNLDVTLGIQMVLMPNFGDQIIPIAKMGNELGVDYTVIKHCSDDEMGTLNINYKKYKDLFPILKEAEKSYTTDKHLVKVKWSKIKTGRNRVYKKCYGTPLLLQVSGSGTVAPCGSFFNPKYKKYHIGNIADTRLKDLWNSDIYWEKMNMVASDRFDARTDCETLCIHDKINEFLWEMKENIPKHINFI